MSTERSRSFVAAFAVLALGALAAHVTGCGAVSSETLCQKVCDCSGCSQKEQEECVSDVDILKKKADDAGCSSEFSDYTSCVNDNLQCKNGDNPDISACDAESAAFKKCATGSKSSGGDTAVGLGGDDCTAAGDHLQECLDISSTGDGSSSAACEGTAACVAACINAADCDAIKDAYSGEPTDKSKGLTDCISVCASSSGT